MKSVKVILLILMGVFGLGGCTMYRIKVSEHQMGVRYYFPQKRVGLGEWNDIKTFNGSYTYRWAREIIERDKISGEIKYYYIK